MTNRDFRIVVGCDDSRVLSSLLISLKSTCSEGLNFISAARESDLINIVKSIDPSLVILSFQNNESALKNFDFYVNRSDIPVLCLTHPGEIETIYLSSISSVFTYPVEHVSNEEYLWSRVRSIVQLRQGLPGPGFMPPEIVDRSDSDVDVNLSRYVMELDQKKEILCKIRERIVELYPSVEDQVRNELVSIANSIKISFSDSRVWEDFKVSFERIDPHFLSSLSRKHPDLTTKDLKYCCYLKMNMSNDDIRSMLGINQESVRTHKYRLKKKMALSKEQDLTQYIRSVGNSDSRVLV